MNLTTLKVDLSFWDEFAPWYEKWATRGTYHRPLVRELSQMIEPSWKVLDIGAATGVLSFPMASLGCTVDALEPSKGMLNIFREKIRELSVEGINIIQSRWEDFASQTEYDLILSSNSLHLTEGGIMEGMKKVFSFHTKYICLITEINQSLFIDFKEIDALQQEYDFLYIKNYRLDSSFIFQSLEEAEALSALLNRDIQLTEEQGNLIETDSTDVAVLWWEKA